MNERARHPRLLRRALAAGAACMAGIAGIAVWGEEVQESVITADGVRRHALVLGSDEFEGRAPGTRGGDLAAAYLVEQLAAAGLEPLGGGGSYRQMVPLHGSTPGPDSRLVMSSLGTERVLELGEDYLLFTAGSQTLIPRRVGMVFVGYGIVAPEFDYNDYQNVDVRGKAVVYLVGEPSSDDPRYFLGEMPTVYAAPETKRRVALSRGAVASLLVPLAEGEVDAAWRRTARDFAFEHLDLAYSLPEHLSAVLHPDVGQWLLSDSLYALDQVTAMERTGTLRSFHLPAEVSFVGSFAARDMRSPNVVARLPGRDPELADSHVVVVAHYDHLGVGPEVAGDAIYNGVVDNALGVSCALEVAHALAAARRATRRSVLFLLTTAEEAGLLGARYFLDHPPVPLGRMAAAVNVDGLAFLDDFDDLVGIGGELSNLGELLERAVAPLGMRTAPPPDRVWEHAAYGRSDQLAFAEAGIPAILVNEGFSWHSASPDEALEIALEWMRTTYHSPQDDLLQPLDFDASARHCEAVLRLVLEIANHPGEPAWRPGVPYAYQRLLSLAEGR